MLSDRTLDTAGRPVNPLFAESSLPLGYPRFDRIRTEHFREAFLSGMEEQRLEIQRIVQDPERPTFQNVFERLERSGRVLQRVKLIFFNLVGAHTNDELEAIRTEMAPRLSAHADTILLDEGLFRKIDAVYRQRGDIRFDPEPLRLIERYHLMFVRAGARLSDEDKERLKEVNREIAELATRFSQNVLKEVNESSVVVDTPDALAGLTPPEITAAAGRADEQGRAGKFVLPLQNTTGQPVTASLHDRALRRRIHEVSVSRGSSGGLWDNREIVSRVVRLRAERARLLGYRNHADYVLADQTAQTPEAVDARLAQLVPAAVRNARREAARLQRTIDAEGGGFELKAWDWAYYAEKVRSADYALDQASILPYFQLDRVLEDGVFQAARVLFGLDFEERHDLPTYHPDVRTFDVRDQRGDTVALFVADLYARPSKRGGAWMSSYVRQSKLLGDRPVVANHQNIAKPPEGEPTLLTLDEVVTMFHEFGHGLHGLLSDVHFPFFSGTAVPRDFVEFPSQFYEMWALWPEILARYAVHHETGAPMPSELAEKVRSMRLFNQGFATTEYLAACVIDQALHQLQPDEVPDAASLMDFEAEVLHRHGIDLEAVPPRYRVPYFSHIMGGYDAGYYAYIWAEVMDADAVRWFEDHGGLTRENGEQLRQTVLARGGSAEAMDMYRAFSGREPAVEPLLERRGLVGV